MADAETPAKLVKRDYASTVKVLVGKDEKEFIVHKDLLNATSLFFRAALEKEWKEGQEKVVCLPECKQYCFEVYVEYIYKDTIDVQRLKDACAHQIFNEAWPNSDYLASTWIFGEYIQDRYFCNKVMDCLLKKADATKIPMTGSMLNGIWVRTTPGSKLRDYFTDLTAHKVNRDWLSKHGANTPLEIVLEMAKRLADGTGKGRKPSYSNKCDYHVRADGATECCQG